MFGCIYSVADLPPALEVDLFEDSVQAEVLVEGSRPPKMLAEVSELVEEASKCHLKKDQRAI